MNDASAAAHRDVMVREQIERRGVRDTAVLEAMRQVPREVFVPAALRERAWDDTPLPIAEGQTISQPYVVAWMLEAAGVRRGDHVLEIGAGSGYACAVASRIAARVDAVERHATLCAQATARVVELGYANVAIHHADGSAGWPPGAPYDVILVAASGPHIPTALRAQLAVGGRLVMPVGADVFDQRLRRLTRVGEDEEREEDLGGVVFVPLIGEQGWPEG